MALLFFSPATKAPSHLTHTPRTPPTAFAKTNSVAFCNSCHCYSFLSTCIKFNNKSFGVKRKQNQSARKKHTTMGKRDIFQAAPHPDKKRPVWILNFKRWLKNNNIKEMQNGMWGDVSSQAQIARRVCKIKLNSTKRSAWRARSFRGLHGGNGGGIKQGLGWVLVGYAHENKWCPKVKWRKCGL